MSDVPQACGWGSLHAQYGLCVLDPYRGAARCEPMTTTVVGAAGAAGGCGVHGAVSGILGGVSRGPEGGGELWRYIDDLRILELMECTRLHQSWTILPYDGQPWLSSLALSVGLMVPVGSEALYFCLSRKVPGRAVCMIGTAREVLLSLAERLPHS